MKKLISLILALSLCFTLFAACGEGSSDESTASTTETPSTTAPDEGPDAMYTGLTALELVHMMGNGTNLGNTMEACDSSIGSLFMDDPSYYETTWGQPVTTQEMIQGMKDAGFDTLRIPVAWMTNATDLATTGDYTISQAYLARVKEIVDYAYNADMFVIINDHWDGGWYGMFGSESPETQALAMEAYIGMWKQIAEYFADYDYHLIFEGANEELGGRFDENSTLYCSDSVISYLTEDERYQLTNRINQAFVDTVRGTGGNNASRFLLIPGYSTNIAQTCDDRFVMPSDTAEDRLLISVHFYDPWSFCGDGQSTVKWGTQGDIQTMIDTLSKMQKFTDQGIGVVIGEYGVLYATEVQENTALYHQCFLSICDQYNFTSCLWDCSAFFNRRTLTMVDELAGYYAAHDVDAHALMTIEEEGIMGQRRLKSAISEAPESFREGTVDVTDTTVMAWIMWTDGNYSELYSVGDTYNPDKIAEGLVDTVTVIDGEGTYTVALDFSGTAAGCSPNVQFAALGITNGEIIHPGWCVDILEVKINGEAVALTGKPYTTSDDKICTRVNLYNEWVTAIPDSARTLDGDLTGLTQVPLDRNAAGMAQIQTIEITFYYGPAAN